MVQNITARLVKVCHKDCFVTLLGWSLSYRCLSLVLHLIQIILRAYLPCDRPLPFDESLWLKWKRKCQAFN